MAIPFLQILWNGIFIGLVYGLVAAGVSFLYSTTRIFHLAHGVVILAGGYTFWWAWAHMHLPFLVAVLSALAAAAGIGVVMNEFVYERLRRRGAKGLGYLVSTLAMLIFGTGFIIALFGASPRTFQVHETLIEYGGVSATSLQLIEAGTSTALLVLFFWITRFTKFGKAMRATADNETVAEVLGIDTRRIRRVAFLLASALAGAAGIIFGLEFNLDPNMGVFLAVTGFAAAVVGGVGSFGGTICGALLLGTVGQFVIWFFGAGWKDVISFNILFFFLLLRPQGMFGAKGKE